ncbi:hypothetical protein M885DRAFT_613613 [Pelagophyceae sp. CCMP2097]|nr:hypothetical protein M885DRAFT_613613 [Pelagophyceae sp. CCMP2097]
MLRGARVAARGALVRGVAPPALRRRLWARAVAPALGRAVQWQGRAFSDKKAAATPDCPACADDGTYWDDAAGTFVCTACDHTWRAAVAKPDDDDDDGVVALDCNGQRLARGDTVILMKELSKALAKGIKLTDIKVGVFKDGCNVEATVTAPPGSARSGAGRKAHTMKSEFVKRVKVD